jgi:CheY-like chemotaxis protein
MRTAKQLAPSPSNDSHSVLIVSDDIDLGKQRLMAGLRTRGFAVDTVGTAADLYRQLFREPYDLILVDDALPDENGYSVAARLRCVKRIGVEMLSTLFAVFGSDDDGMNAPRGVDLDKLAAHLGELAEQLPIGAHEPIATAWLRTDTTAQAQRSVS